MHSDVYTKPLNIKYKILFCKDPYNSETMSRIFISCIILVIYVYSSCLAASANVAEFAEQGQSEFELPYGGKWQIKVSLV